MSGAVEFPVRVGSETDTECHCLENGADGTTAHGEIVGMAQVELPNLIVTAVFCENHRQNYENWKQLPLTARAESEGRRRG